MMRVHKEILKVIREVYENAISNNPHISRADLVQVFKKEIAKFCFALMGRTPMIVPILIEKK